VAGAFLAGNGESARGASASLCTSLLPLPTRKPELNELVGLDAADLSSLDSGGNKPLSDNVITSRGGELGVAAMAPEAQQLNATRPVMRQLTRPEREARPNS
jgi:hypothetical protein